MKYKKQWYEYKQPKRSSDEFKKYIIEKLGEGNLSDQIIFGFNKRLEEWKKKGKKK